MGTFWGHVEGIDDILRTFWETFEDFLRTSWGPFDALLEENLTLAAVVCFAVTLWIATGFAVVTCVEIVSLAGETGRHPTDGRERIAILEEFLTLIYQGWRVPNPECVKVDDAMLGSWEHVLLPFFVTCYHFHSPLLLFCDNMLPQRSRPPHTGWLQEKTVKTRVFKNVLKWSSENLQRIPKRSSKGPQNVLDMSPNSPQQLLKNVLQRSLKPSPCPRQKFRAFTRT